MNFKPMEPGTTFVTSSWTGRRSFSKLSVSLVWVCCLFWLCFGFSFVAFCVVGFFVLCFSMDCDSCWTCTGPLPSTFVASIFDGGSLYALIG